MRQSCKWLGGKCRMAPVLRSHVFIADSSCLASRTRPRKPKREFAKVFLGFRGLKQLSASRRQGSFIRDRQLFADKNGSLRKSPCDTHPHAIRNIVTISPQLWSNGGGGKWGGLIRCIAQRADLVGEKSPVALCKACLRNAASCLSEQKP